MSPIRNEHEVEINIAKIKREGHVLIVPQTMNLRQVAQALNNAADDEERIYNYSATVLTAPFDGAWAFNKALEELCGIASQRAVWGQRDVIEVPVDAHGGFISVPWGAFEVPGVNDLRGRPGIFSTGAVRDDNGRWVFQAGAAIPGKYKELFDLVVARTREIVAAESIYKGKALDLRLSDRGAKNGMAKVKFFDVTQAGRPIFSATVEDRYEYDVITYVTQPEMVRELRGSSKLGVLLAGKPGVGKTMAVAHLARLCQENGRTFVQGHVEDFTEVIDFATMYSPSMVGFEDVDGVLGGDVRSHSLNAILNKMDGVDTKGADIIFVATTNFPERLNDAATRVGRIDVILNVDPPDADASIEIAKHYARGKVKSGEDFSEAGRVLAGHIPAEIEQAVARAQIRGELKYGSPDLTADTLLAAARAVEHERSQFVHEPDLDPMERFGQGLGRGIATAVAPLMEQRVTNGKVLA